MGFILTDLASEENELYVNSWNWRPTIELIRRFKLIDDERLEFIGMQLGTLISEEEAHIIGIRLRDEIIPLMKPDDRITIDLQITDKPDDYIIHQGDEWKENYGAMYNWLNKFVAFCLSSKGFTVG